MKSYLNGDDVPKFEANVTGFLNRRRRVHIVIYSIDYTWIIRPT